MMRVIRRCLEKDPEQRFQQARDLVFALEAVSEGSGQTVVAAVDGGPKSRWPRVGLIGIGIGAGLLLGVVATGRPDAPTPALPAPVVVVASAPKPAVARRVSFRNGTILNARFTADGRGVAYAGAFENTPARVYSGVLDGAQLRSASGPGMMLFDVSDKDDLALGGAWEEGASKGGLVLSRGSLAGGTPRPLSEGVLWADFGPREAMVLTRFADSRWRIEFPPGQVLVTATHQLNQARLSPDATMIAFVRHPVLGDDRGRVEIIDLAGKSLATSASAWTLDGLAWSPTGKEVWFSAGYDDVARQIHALALDGTQRLVYSGPGSIHLFDVDPKGRVLAATGITRSRMFGKVAGDTRERSLSWLDGSMPLDLSADGEALLFLEGFGPAGTEVQTWFRRFDQPDDAPVLLGLGWGRALSPDKRWAVISATPPFNTLRLVPTGVGVQRDLPADDFQALGNVRYFADGQRIAFSAFDRDNQPHLYVQTVVEANAEAGVDTAPVRVSDEGFSLAAAPSPDGQWLVGYESATRRAALVPVNGEGAPPRPLEKLTPGDLPLQWSTDGKSLWLMRRPKANAEIGVQLLRYELATGKTTPMITIQPADPVGMGRIMQGVVTPDGRHYVYTANQQLDELYLIEGVR